ncbi:DUF397 domain-containing protein [Streptomyces sp. NPDC087844]|uniref:DUF397 domain-containing protein n=1 Tax=Streptomyces sp. NPDC087844 TaxID=3365805 RepID=UPI0037FC4AA7
MPEFDFVKSSYSTFANECVEVARNVPDTVAVRDSKDLDGPILRLSPTAWAEFTTARALDGARQQ